MTLITRKEGEALMKMLPEHTLTYSRECEWALGGGPLESNVC